MSNKHTDCQPQTIKKDGYVIKINQPYISKTGVRLHPPEGRSGEHAARGRVYFARSYGSRTSN